MSLLSFRSQSVYRSRFRTQLKEKTVFPVGLSGSTFVSILSFQVVFSSRRHIGRSKCICVTRSHLCQKRKKPTWFHSFECLHLPNEPCTDVDVSILLDVTWSVQALPLRVGDCVHVLPSNLLYLIEVGSRAYA